MSSRRLSGPCDRQRDASTSNYKRMKTIERASTDYGANLTNTAYLSRDLLCLKERKLLGQTPAKRMILKNPDQQDASTSNYKRMKTIERASTDYGANLTNTAYLSRDLLCLKERKLLGQTPAKRMILKNPDQQDASTSNYKRMKTIERSSTDYGANLTHTAYLSRGLLCLKERKLFGQTPAKRMILKNPDQQEEASYKIHFVITKQWTLKSVTPLHKFSYGKLGEYSRRLSNIITAHKEKRFVLDGETDLMFQVKFSSFSLLKTKGKNPRTVVIEIMQRPQMVDDDNEEEEKKVVWIGCFCYPCTSDFVETLPKDFTCFPLFLVHGAQGFTNIVETWFQQTFDCYFSPLHISPIHLAWMAAMWSGCSTDHRTHATELTFSVPHLPYPLDISYAIHSQDAKALWDSIHGVQEDIKHEDVELFMNALYKHFHSHFNIYLSSTQLVKVSTYVAYVHSLGKIKIHRIEHLMGVLSLLTELALSKIM